MYKTLIKPDVWGGNLGPEQGLGVFEREILRRIYGPICEEAVW